ncbi:MAG: hypothetical protein SGPRY_008426, partial [Prymnesium sp.]
VCYVLPNDFKIVSGAAHVKTCKFVSAPERGSRNFCGKCGTRICNLMSDGRVGFFPNTLRNSARHALPQKFCATLHHCPEEAVIPLPDDGLERQPNRYAYARAVGAEC